MASRTRKSLANIAKNTDANDATDESAFLNRPALSSVATAHDTVMPNLDDIEVKLNDHDIWPKSWNTDNQIRIFFKKTNSRQARTELQHILRLFLVETIKRHGDTRTHPPRKIQSQHQMQHLEQSPHR